MSRTNDEIRAEGKQVSWPLTVVTASGRARNIALVVAELYSAAPSRAGGPAYPLDPPERCEHVEYLTIDAQDDPVGWSMAALQRFNETLRDGEQAREFVRVLDLGPTAAHVFVRLPAGGADGELFKCSKCAIVVTGHPTFDALGSPYALNPPPEKRSADRRRFFSHCGH